MIPNYFASAIFTPQEILFLCVIAFVLLGVAVGAVSFLVRKLLGRGKGKNPKISRYMIFGFAVVATIILIFILIPKMIKDSRWERKQQTCAERAGYTNPAEDNSNIATSETQSKYRQCLEL